MLDAGRKAELAGALGELLSMTGGSARVHAGNALNDALDENFKDFTDDQKIEVCDFLVVFNVVGNEHPAAPVEVRRFLKKSGEFCEAAAILRASGVGVLDEIDLGAIELIHVLGLEQVFKNATADFFKEADSTFNALMGAFDATDTQEDIVPVESDSAEAPAESAPDAEEDHGTIVVEL